MSEQPSSREHLPDLDAHVRTHLFPDESHRRELLALYFLTVADRLALAAAVLSGHDWRELERLAHGIRGSSEHVGAKSMAVRAAALEEAAGRHDAGAARDFLATLEEVFNELHHEHQANERA